MLSEFSKFGEFSEFSEFSFELVGSLIINNFGYVGNDTINSMLFQYFINYNLPGGSYFNSVLMITANLNTAGGEQYLI